MCHELTPIRYRSNALDASVTPIVVVHKIDYTAAIPPGVVHHVLDLFIDLGAD